jgi:CheY-like chemotaxis protein
MSGKILVVDHEPDGCAEIVRHLSRAGYDVHCVLSGREAVALIGTQVPHAIVLDYNMPEMDGVAVLEVFRSYLRWADVPVVMLSKDPNEPRLRHVSDHGVRHVLSRSGDSWHGELLRCLEKVVAVE